MDLVCVKTFNNRVEANLAVDRLKEENIYAIVFSDDQGGCDPALAITQGVRVMVRKEDLEIAYKIIEQ